MVYEEFFLEDIEDYLDKNIDLLIVGTPNKEERSKFFYEKYIKENMHILLFDQYDEEQLKFTYVINGNINPPEILDINTGIPNIFKKYKINEKKILMDLSSLSHVLIMYITKIILKEICPLKFFASYIRPKMYNGTIENIDLTSEIVGIRSVPGYVKRGKLEEVLCAFIGFEGK